MNDKVILDDLDLLALADGLLETDPVRRAEVEAAIAASPAEFARLRDYRAQTQALRSAYGGRISEPVPERLQAALEGGDGGHWRPLLRIAAGVALRALVDQSYRQFAARAPDEPGDAITLAATGQRPLGWLEDDVSIRLRAPDLSSERFALVDKQAHRDGDEQIIRLDYAAPDGRAFSLFIAPRWEDRAAPIREAERDGVALAYWHDGPLASSIATRLPKAEAREIAQAVRRAMKRELIAPPPLLQPRFRPLDEPGRGVIADTLGVPMETDRPAKAQAASGGTVKPN